MTKKLYCLTSSLGYKNERLSVIESNYKRFQNIFKIDILHKIKEHSKSQSQPTTQFQPAI